MTMQTHSTSHGAPLARELPHALASRCRGPRRERPPSTVLQLFEAQVARTPERVAVRHGELSLRYRELQNRVEQLSAALIAEGVRPGHLVALCAVRSLEMVVAMLAIMRVGAAYVPIDPDAPSARVHAILGESEPWLVLASAAVKARVELGLSRVLPLEALIAQGARGGVAAPVPGPLAYVIFTSGSTGTPKGVEVRHESLTNHALSMIELYALTSEDVVLCSASIGFDVAAEQLYPALLTGAEVVVRPEHLFDSLTTFAAFLESAEVSTLILPTALFHEWVHALETGALRLPRSLRALGVGTEQVRAHELSVFLRLGGGNVRFLQGYGPTEATVTCTAYVHQGGELDPHTSVPIGTALPNTEAYVLDAHGALAADGELGELYVGGVALARGYLRRPELTSERFVRHPFSSDPDARLYRTGDLVRRAADGQLHFEGREDFQIKVRGHRVEPREIELVLLEQPGVREALVMLRAEQQGAPRLVAYLVADRPLATADLAHACRVRLPPYMVPSAFVTLPAFPMTINQKVDRNALPSPEAAVDRARLSARNDAELLVQRAFEQALGVRGVGVHDDFFSLGGDSLRALRMLQLIRQSAARELALADVFNAPTVGALAERLSAGDRIDDASVLCLKQGHGTPIFLVCGIQIYQALADALTAENPVYALLLPSEGAIANGRGKLPSVEKFAADYVRVLRAHTPDGPYVLGGLSLGGAVAYEMAQQLTRQGTQVALVVLFDTVLPRSQRRFSPEAIEHELRSLRAEGLAGTGRRVRRLAAWAARTALRRLGPAPLPEADGASNEAAILALDAERERAFGERFAAYDDTILPYRGKVVLFRGRDSELGARLPCYGFARLVRDLTVHDVPGDHLGLLRTAAGPALPTLLAQELENLPVRAL